MTVILNGTSYYRTQEAAEAIGVSKQTLLRWISQGKISDVKKRDRNGWRLFSAGEVSRIIIWNNGDIR